jgi:uncharacterized Zn-finger protein
MHSIVHSEDTKPFKCPMEGCKSKFSHKHHLSRHKKEQHDVEKPFKVIKTYLEVFFFSLNVLIIIFL